MGRGRYKCGGGEGMREIEGRLGRKRSEGYDVKGDGKSRRGEEKRGCKDISICVDRILRIFSTTYCTASLVSIPTKKRKDDSHSSIAEHQAAISYMT